MKQTKIIAAVLLAIFTGLMSSCLGKDDSPQEYTEQQNLSGYFNQIADLTTGESMLYSGVGYQMTIDYTAGKVKLQVTGLRLPDGSSYPSLTFQEIPYTVKEGWLVINQNDLTPVGGGVKVPIFDNLKIRLIYLSLSGNMRYPITDITYTVNGQYRVSSMATEYVMFGDATVRGADGSVFEAKGDDQSLYIYNLDMTKKEAVITIGGAKFAENMPAMNMKFSGIPFTVGADGIVKFECESLTPSIITGTGEIQNEVPYPSFPITDLTGTYNQAYGMQLFFTCSMLDKEGKVKNSYRVSVDTKVQLPEKQ